MGLVPRQKLEIIDVVLVVLDYWGRNLSLCDMDCPYGSPLK